ncbi:protein farnesyltransferase/geranylgeranyltransferase type-1 subunit alpha [Atheta coriaria]|uniref:protein farnesyltransferase/geranylgeranyltransferase type-1 subunit alpha n=1 Tax=Dalotia coriaria TaxID=877792 RepID=UPI0031F3AF19
MSVSSDEDQSDSQEWVFYRDRPEWKDIEPIPQDDGEEPIVSIAYSPKFQDVFDYLRGAMKISEKSERVLQLTQDAIELNAANYTVWQYRRDILKEMKADLWQELNYINSVIENYQKNYQVWYHRKVIVEWLKDGSSELEFTERVLEMDAKNYHAWQHRQWAIKTFKMFDSELDYVDKLLQDDIRNNSAWNERYFVIHQTTGFTEEVVKNEVEYTLEKIAIAKENESAWNYLRGLLLYDKNGLSKNVHVTDFCEKLYASGNRSPFLLALIVDMCDEQIVSGSGDARYTLERAKQLCSDLATEYDTIRCKYWEYMANTIEKKSKGEQPEEEASAST